MVDDMMVWMVLEVDETEIYKLGFSDVDIAKVDGRTDIVGAGEMVFVV